MKRLLLLEDDDIERILSWYSSSFGTDWSADTRNDPGDEDEELFGKLSAARLAS